jgi:phosphoglycolate phosphatase
MKYRGVIFDLDGTLVDTIGDIAASMNRALLAFGFPALETGDYRDKVGWGLKKLAFLAMPPEARNEETAARLASRARDFYIQSPLVFSRPYPGIPDLAAGLGRMKIRTAVLTNKNDRVAHLVIAGLFPPSSFDIVRGGGEDRPRKPDPAAVWELLVELDLNPADTVLVGDSEIDMEAARGAGCFALGVSWGYRSREVLENAGAAMIARSPGEILDLIGNRRL